MKKIKLYIAASLDGYIARPDDDLDWLLKFPAPVGAEYGYEDFINSVDTVIMGGRTYRELLAMDVIWPYKTMHSYVVSHHEWNTEENISFITKNIIETISALHNQEGKDIWLLGGGELISMLLDADLVDEMQISYVPVMLGNGIPLFPKHKKESRWKLTGSSVYNSGIIKIDYQRT